MIRPAAWVPVVALGIAFAYALFIEPLRIEVTHHAIGTPPEGAQPIRIVQLSDLHLRSIGRLEQAVVREVAQLKPDILVLSGDVVDDARSLSVLESFLAMLAPGHKLAVLGNWEHWSGVDLEELRALYSKHGVNLLVNETARYRIADRTLSVIGLDDFTAGRPDAALVAARAPSEIPIVIQHSPGWFETPAAKTANSRASLCVSGHTHGGQIALFGAPLWTPRGSGEFIAGRYDRTMCPLYVSRGIGTSIAPVRFGARPEIAVFSL